ncbi:hypothetical protein ABZX38_09085 [Streptomyces longwoodensis]|uniref:hypothetical protein n=1 Tax=Streptomyces longwoodensis TaxID=68231 RepID=UPI0033BEB60E
MLRHEFRPGRLVAGTFFVLAGVTFAGDAGGLWDTPWFAMIPIVVVGLALAAVTALLAGGIRRRRRGTDGGEGGTSGGGGASAGAEGRGGATATGAWRGPTG